MYISLLCAIVQYILTYLNSSVQTNFVFCSGKWIMLRLHCHLKRASIIVWTVPLQSVPPDDIH